MDLEGIVERMHAAWDTRFITRAERGQRLAGISERFAPRASLSNTDLTALDRIWARMATDPHAGMYQDAIAQVQRLRRPYRPAGPRIAHAIMQAKGTRYADRFAELREYLAQDTYTYDDVALALGSLERNAYVRRRARRDDGFSNELADIREDLEHALYRRSQQTRSRTPLKKRLVRAGALAASSALALAACIPTAAYAALLG